MSCRTLAEAYPRGFGTAMVKLYEQHAGGLKLAVKDRIASTEPILDLTRYYKIASYNSKTKKGMWACAKLSDVLSFLKHPQV